MPPTIEFQEFDWTNETGRRNRWVRAFDRKLTTTKFNSRAITPARFNEFVAAVNAALTLLEPTDSDRMACGCIGGGHEPDCRQNPIFADDRNGGY